jgi:hypothetical protein
VEPAQKTDCRTAEDLLYSLKLAFAFADEKEELGQVALIRMATDPSWDYYGFISGSE